MNELNATKTTKDPAWFLCVLTAGMLLFSFYASTHMVAAGDTWVAMACGRHFADHGVDTVEPFSFNSHKAGPSDEQLKNFPKFTHSLIRKLCPTGWIDQNWLTQLIFYKIAKWGVPEGEYNYNMLVYWKFVLYGLTALSVFGIARVVGVSNLLSAAAACLAMVVGRTFYDIRPAGYSNLLVPVFLLVLVLAVYRNHLFIWLLVPLIVFWANVHGGYIYVFIMLAPFIGIHLLLMLDRRWTICLGFVGLWLVLYLISYKFITNNYYIEVLKLRGIHVAETSLVRNGLFMGWMLLAATSIGLTLFRSIKPVPFYAYHIGANIIYFMALLTRFSANIPRNLTPQFKEIYASFVSGSIFSFLFVFFAGGLLVLAMATMKKRFLVLPRLTLYHIIGASAAAFFAMIVLNPFHLTNLTHTFEISVSKHAESWRQVNEWKPAFDWMDKTTDRPNPVGQEEWFGVLCILTCVVLVAWGVVLFLKPKPQSAQKRSKFQQEEPDTIGWPKIDLAFLAISLLTIYMAIRSRRFIAIAGSAAAPAVMLMITQCRQMITTRLQWNRESDSPVFAVPKLAHQALYGVITVAILIMGVVLGAKFKRIYLDPWPTDGRYHSVFMRMTASHLKPFEVCKFINDNHISGRVFNYWTEGGAVAFGQIPDRETGRTPLQLFMDGRAQAAYNHDSFKKWQSVFGGGTDGIKASQIRAEIKYYEEQGLINTPEYREAKKIYNDQFPKLIKKTAPWLDSQLKKYHVWVTLMPQSEENSVFMLALKETSNWKTAYQDQTQHLLVDTDTDKGKEMIAAVLEGKAVFPDDFSKNLTTATVIMETQNSTHYNNLYSLLKNAFEEMPSPLSTVMMVRLGSNKAFMDPVMKDLQQYLEDFLEHREEYRQTDGYGLRLRSAQIAADFLSNTHPEQRKQYQEYIGDFNRDSANIQKESIW